MAAKRSKPLITNRNQRKQLESLDGMGMERSKPKPRAKPKKKSPPASKKTTYPRGRK